MSERRIFLTRRRLELKPEFYKKIKFLEDVGKDPDVFTPHDVQQWFAREGWSTVSEGNFMLAAKHIYVTIKWAATIDPSILSRRRRLILEHDMAPHVDGVIRTFNEGDFKEYFEQVVSYISEHKKEHRYLGSVMSLPFFKRQQEERLLSISTPGEPLYDTLADTIIRVRPTKEISNTLLRRVFHAICIRRMRYSYNEQEIWFEMYKRGMLVEKGSEHG